MKIILSRFVLVFLLAGFGLSALRAQSTDTLAPPPLMLQLTALDNGRVEVAWYPTSETVWAQLLKEGYTVSRQAVDASGRNVGSAATLATRILPRDSTWFARRAATVQGVIAPIKALLYDTTFQVTDPDGLDANAQRFNYIGYEVFQDQKVASAVGLGLTDSTAQSSSSYRYTVTGLGSTRPSASAVILSGEFGLERNTWAYEQDWQLPNNRSLSDMLAESQPTEQEYVAAIARGYGDSVIVRWAPTTPKLWRAALTNGYSVSRIASGDTAFVQLQTVLPLPEKSLTRELIARDSAVLIAAGIIYRKSNTDRELSLYDRASIEKNSFGFALFAADQSQAAAQVLGLRYVDRSVRRDSTYRYVIRPLPAKGDSTSVGRSGFVEITNTYEPTAAPIGLSAKPLDSAVEIVWEKFANDENLTAYDLERSTNAGKTFQKLNQRPIVFVEDDQIPLERYSYLDTTVVNNNTYLYRLTGFDSFGERSEAATAEAKPADQTPPRGVSIYRADYNPTAATIAIGWKPYAVEPDLKYRVLLLSEDTDGPWVEVSPQLAPRDTNFLYKMPDKDHDRGYFFAVRSVDVAGNVAQSTLSQAIVPDLEAPLAPTNLVGTVDTNSFVTITWSPSPSKDVEGYWLYWGNRATDEMAVVNPVLIQDTSYTYYIDKKALQREIFYCLRAEDDVANRGFVSEVVKVRRLDVIPPTAPVMLGASESSGGGIQVNWEPGDDEELAYYHVYRYAPDAELALAAADTITAGNPALAAAGATLPNWVYLARVDAREVGYTDLPTAAVGTSFRYRVVAEDAAGNISKPSVERGNRIAFPAASIVPQQIELVPVQGAPTPTAKLTWTLPVPSAVYVNEPRVFEIYRSTGAGYPELYSTVKGATLNFSDAGLSSRTLYNYAIRVRYENGWMGEMSEMVSVFTE